MFSQPPRAAPSSRMPNTQPSQPRAPDNRHATDEAAEAYHKRKISRVASKFNAVRASRDDE